MRPGLGLSPNPDAPHITFQNNSNVIKHICYIRTTVWARSGVRSPRTPLYFEQTTNTTVPRGSPSLGHVAPHHLSNKCHMSYCDSTTSASMKLPHHQCHISVRTYDLCHVSLYGLYGLHSQRPFFYLFDDSNRSRYLSLPTSF
jgi:hypothetical protein